MKRIFLFYRNQYRRFGCHPCYFGHLGHQQYRPSRQPVGLFCSRRLQRLDCLPADVETIAKHSVGAVVIDQPQSEEEAWLLATVEAQARQWI